MNSFYYYKTYCYRRMKGFQISLRETFYTSNEFKFLIITNLLNIIHPIPGYDYLFIYESLGNVVRYSLQTLLSTLMFSRVYLVVRIIPLLSVWNDVQSEELCESEGFEAGFAFAMKAVLKQKTY